MAERTIKMRRGPVSEMKLVVMASIYISFIAFAFYYIRGEVLLYGDAVAHLNIARALFDSTRPGPMQLGSVWLPLPHLLQAPFVYDVKLWMTGAGASLPSMAAYVFGVIGVYKLLRARAMGRWALLGAAIYGLNPSLLYMQSTAMSEPLFLAEMIWATYYLDEFRRGLFPPSLGHGEASPREAWRSLERMGVVLAMAILTRYDGWVYSFIAGCAVFGLLMRWRKRGGAELNGRRLTRSFVSFVLLLALAPSLWLAQNYYVNRKPLDWLNGPYSAKAIEQRTSKPGAEAYPGKADMKTAEKYFIKDAVMTMGEGRVEWLLLAAICVGAVVLSFHFATYGRWLLLAAPLPFYAYSIAYGSVPIFMPVWKPFSYYNVRYGLEMLPFFALMLTLAIEAFSGVRVKRGGAIVSYALILLVAVGYASSWMGDSHSDWGVRSPKKGPICYREALVNSQDRTPVVAWLGQWLAALPPDSRVMMRTSELVGAVQKAGAPLRNIVNEQEFERWQAAQSAPAAVADYVVAISDDDVAKAVRNNPQGLEKLSIYHDSRGNTIAIYHSLWRGGR